MAQINLFDDLAEIAAQELTALGAPPDGSEDPETLIRHAIETAQRVPPQQTWTIEESPEVAAAKQDLDADLRKGLEEINRKARAGEALTPHLSTGIKRPEDPDGLLVSWDIIHMHLGVDPHPKHPNFVERTGPLLFVHLDRANGIIYQLDIHEHGGWSRKELLNILERNWPEVVEDHEVKGVETEGNYTDEEIQAFRDMGVEVLVETPEGRAVIGPGGGFTTAGTSLSAQRFLNHAKTVLARAEERIHEEADRLSEFYRSKHGIAWEDLEFQLVEFGDVLHIKEVNTDETVVHDKLR